MDSDKQVINWQERISKMARASAAAEVITGKFLSCRGGILTYNGTPVAGNALECVIVASTHEHQYYPNPFNPAKVESPLCYAFGKLADDGEIPPMVPHPESTKVQAKSCDSCPMMAWGSDPLGGRGKACKEVRRLALIPMSALKDPEKILGSEEAYLKVPVMSVQNWSNYVHLVAAHETEVFAVVTKLSVVPDARTQFRVNFEMVGKITDNNLLGHLYAKHEKAHRAIDFPYPKSEAEAKAGKGKLAK
jgi:hypothetical protein